MPSTSCDHATPAPAERHDDTAQALAAAVDAARRRLQDGDVAEARTLLETLQARHADDSRVLALLALARRRVGRPAAARELLEQAVGIEPQNPELWFNLGNLRRGLDDDEAADLAYQRALNCDPSFVPALLNRGNLLRDGGQLPEAVEHYRRALAVQPELTQGWINLGRVLRRSGDANGAAVALREACRRLPENAELAQELAALQQRAGHGAAPASAVDQSSSTDALAQVARLRREAEQARAAGDLVLAQQRYQALLAIAPDDIRALQFLGLVEHGLGRPAETRHLWQRVLALKPDDVDTLADLGTLLRNQGEVGPAIDLFRRALHHNANHRAARLSLGFALLTVGAAGEALALGRQLCAELPDNPDAFNLHGYALAEHGDCVGALQALTRAAELAPDNPRILSNLLFASLYHDRLPAAELAALHRHWGARMDRNRPRLPVPEADPDPERPLRIGYLSNDLRMHPVGIFMAPILARHDRARYPALCFSTDPRADDLTRRLRADASQWIDCAGLDDRALAERIRAAGTDILVDLGGHSSGNRLAALSHRPAPIQVIYLGYPYGTGMPAVDHLIGDETLIPPERENLYTERVLRQPASFLCYRCPVAAPEPAPPPFANNGFVTFGSYNALTKLSDRCVDLWARVLTAVPDSRLRLMARPLSDTGTAQRVRQRFGERGIAPERILPCPPRTPLGAYLAEYALIDIALDPVPYNGGTTSCDTLWMGVPLITLAGRGFHERMGASLLTAVGLSELIAEDEDGYVARAAELARDRRRLATLRAGLRPRLQASPLCDEAGFTAALEKNYRRVWERWVEERNAWS